MIPAVDVLLPREDDDYDLLVGRARFNLRRGRITTAFTYDEAYLASSDAFPLDPSLPLQRLSQFAEGLFGCMRDSSPDRWGRHLIARRERSRAEQEGALRTLDEVDYLLGVYDGTRQGALRYALPGSDSRLSMQGEIPPRIELPRLLAASNEVTRGEEGIEELKTLLDAGSGSLGGARPKASVFDGGRLMLAKFSHPGDEWAVMSWEKTALDIARSAGIAVPAAQIVHFGSDASLVLERFDRIGSGALAKRVPYVSAMTMVGGNDGDEHDYIDLAEAIPDFCSAPTRELHDLFQRVVLSIVLHNTDDHFRNIGFVRHHGAWQLSPCFDVNPNPHAHDARVTAIYGVTDADEAKVLAQAVSEFGLTREDARKSVANVLRASGRARMLAKQNRCPEREIQLFERVFSERCTALKDAFGL